MKQENLPPSVWRKIVKAIVVALTIIFGKSKNNQKNAYPHIGDCLKKLPDGKK